MTREEIKVGMTVMCLGKKCEVIGLLELGGGVFLVEVEANGHKLRVAPDSLSPSRS